MWWKVTYRSLIKTILDLEPASVKARTPAFWRKISTYQGMNDAKVPWISTKSSILTMECLAPMTWLVGSITPLLRQHAPFKISMEQETFGRLMVISRIVAVSSLSYLETIARRHHLKMVASRVKLISRIYQHSVKTRPTTLFRRRWRLRLMPIRRL